jgi:hypothetical protein
VDSPPEAAALFEDVERLLEKSNNRSTSVNDHGLPLRDTPQRRARRTRCHRWSRTSGIPEAERVYDQLGGGPAAQRRAAAQQVPHHAARAAAQDESCCLGGAPAAQPGQRDVPRGARAAQRGRPDSALAHPLTVLEQARLVERVDDAFRSTWSSPPWRPRPRTGVTAIGEAKWHGEPVGVEQLQRLEHIRALLPPRRAPEPPRLLLFSPDLSRAARRRSDVEVVDLDRLYRGS